MSLAAFHRVIHLPRSAARTLVGAWDEMFPRLDQAALDAAAGKGWTPHAPDPHCPRCGATAAPTAVNSKGCPFCVGKRLPWDRVVRLGPYREPLNEWIVAMKFAGAWSWGPWLGEALAGRISATENPKAVVCPVPMHWRRRAVRGYNQAQLIALELAKHRRWPEADLLRRVRHTLPQTSLPASKREHNVRGSFAAAKIDLTGWDVWLVDDVKTTGSTLAACARLLRRAGAARVNIAVAAVADPKGQDFKAT